MPNWRRRWPRVIPTRNRLPAPDATHINVHEVGSRVIPHAATTERQGSIPQLSGRNPGYSDVNGHRLHVKTLTGHAVSMSAEEFVAPGRTVAADYINLKIGIPQPSSQVMQKVEYPRIVLVNLAGAVVSKITIQTRQGFLIVAFTIAVDNVQALTGMCVEKMQAVWTVRNGLQFWLRRGKADQPTDEDRRQ